MTRFRTRLRKYRRWSGLTQRQVATVLRLKSRGIVSRWENGSQLPCSRRLLELSALYHRLANELLLPEYRAAEHRVAKRLRQHNLLRA